MTKRIIIQNKIIYIFLLGFIFLNINSQGQTDSLKNTIDSIPPIIKSSIDTISPVIKKEAPKKEPLLSATVYPTAIDSITFDMKDRKAYLYKGVTIKYEEIDMKSGYVEIDFKKNELFAQGIADSLGNESETPNFNDGTAEFRSKEMNYNFKTEKGLIKEVITQEGEGYLHGKKVKKLNDNINYVSHGMYTTCNLDHPHFAFVFTKAKTTTNKIITGHIYPEIAGVPLYIGPPFAYLPKQKGQQSGLIIPTYGEAPGRGFYLQNGGYYFGINDYFDAEIRGDIYTRGSWAVKPKVNYKVRYKYSGNFAFSYAVNVISDEDKRKDFSINWSHNQDAKARPNSKFSARVNIKSSKFNETNPTSSQDFLTNTYTSSINYQTKLFNKLNLTAKAGHNQNTKTGTVNITLPEISISAQRFYPFKRKTQVGSEKWYEKISVNYSMNATNKLKTQDTLLTAEYLNRIMDDFENGLKHNISIAHTTKLMKYINLNLSAKYTERWYSRRIEEDYLPVLQDYELESAVDYSGDIMDRSLINPPTEAVYENEIVYDTVYGFYAVRDFSGSASMNTTVYGNKRFAKGPLTAVRHVMKPNVSFSYRPDFSTDFWGYYDRYTGLNDIVNDYSYYKKNVYGTSPNGKSGNINFSLGNNLEIKVRNRKDTITGEKKVKLIESFSVSSSYNLAADSLRWSKLSLSGRTSFLKNKLRLTYAASFDPYVFDTIIGRRINTFEWTKNGQLFRKESASWGLNLSYNLKSTEFKEWFNSDKGSEGELNDINQNRMNYMDWNNPWDLKVDYSIKYTNMYNTSHTDLEQKVIQTLNFNGNVNITKKWKVGVRSGYDFEAKAWTYTSLNIYRDLHCWTMRINWIPTGRQKSWNFTLQAKSSLLQDLKLELKRDFRDNF